MSHSRTMNTDCVVSRSSSIPTTKWDGTVLLTVPSSSPRKKRRRADLCRGRFCTYYLMPQFGGRWRTQMECGTVTSIFRELGQVAVRWLMNVISDDTLSGGDGHCEGECGTLWCDFWNWCFWCDVFLLLLWNQFITISEMLGLHSLRLGSHHRF